MYMKLFGETKFQDNFYVIEIKKKSLLFINERLNSNIDKLF